MKDKFRKLNQINEDKWLANYAKARLFYDQYGHFPNQKEDVRLYQWAMQWWRNTYLKEPDIHQEKARKLHQVGFSHKTGKQYYDQLWMKNYAQAKAFFEEHGHFPTLAENKKLRSWVRTWWKQGATRHPDRVQMLQSIGYTYETVDEHSERLWNECYQRAKAFFEEHGHFPNKGEAGSLRNWATRWWNKSAGQQPEKAKLLTGIGFSYQSVDERYEEKWMKNYGQAKAFFEEHRHFPTTKENSLLNMWAQSWWRQTYLKSPAKYAEKAVLLKRIGFIEKTNQSQTLQ